MSHFSVMVIIPNELSTGDTRGEYLERVLAPFNENLEIEKVIEYTKEDLEKTFLELKDEYEYETIEEMVEEYYGYKLDEEGNAYYMRNPNAKWDWWTIGGRWRNMLVTKDGTLHDAAYIKDIDFPRILEVEKENRAKAYDECMEKEEHGDFRFYLYGVMKGDTREEHIAKAKGLQTFAVINKQGEWLEKGQMGWFGMSSATEEDSQKWRDAFYETHIAGLDPEDGIVIVDCHI